MDFVSNDATMIDYTKRLSKTDNDVRFIAPKTTVVLDTGTVIKKHFLLYII